MSNQYAGPPATQAETATPRPPIPSRSHSPGPSMPKKPKRSGMTDREWAHTMLAFYQERTKANFEKAKIYEEKAKSHRKWMEKDADSTVEDKVNKLDAEEAGKASLESVLDEARARARERREPQD
ncbi:hypothetical protein ACHAP5_007668 [Fusarium lateritium]